MKRIFFIVFLAVVLFLVGCNEYENCPAYEQVVGEPTEPCLVWMFIEYLEETHPTVCSD